MEVGWFLLGLGLVTLIGASPFLQRRALRRHLEVVKATASHYGLNAIEVGPDFGALLIGEIDALRLTIEGRSRQEAFQTHLLAGPPARQGVVILVDGLGLIPKDLSLGRPGGRLGAPERDLEIGDPDFDQRVAIYGHEFTALALLDPQTRSMVAELVVRYRINIARGRIEYFGEHPLPEPSIHFPLINEMLSLGQRLILAPEEVPRRLAYNLEHEPIAGVRRHLARALFGGHPTNPIVIECLSRYVSDEDPLVRFYAESSNPETGRAFLEHAVSNTEFALSLRAFAAHRLGPRQVAALIPELTEAVPLLVQAMDALRRFGSSELAAAAMPVLANPHDRAKVAAAAALGVLGDLHAVAPLLVLRDGLLHSSEVKRAAQDAVAAIQGRHGHPADGALSVAAESEVGALSEDAGAGALSEGPTDGAIDLHDPGSV